MGFLHWLSECEMPVTPVDLSTHSHNLPDSATLREQNDSPDPTYQDCWPSERYKSDGPDDSTPESAWSWRVGPWRSTANKEPLAVDQCSECRCAPGQPHATGCDETAKVTDSVINVESCPECGAVTDIEYVDEGQADTFAVPFKVQEFMFEELCEEKIAELPHLIFTHSERIIEMARDRFRKGYAKYGSAMYAWSPERRLDETLQEVADAVVYPTSGPLE